LPLILGFQKRLVFLDQVAAPAQIRPVELARDCSLIYADTSIWNCLCDQEVNGQNLLSALAAQGRQFVLGENVLSEMAKTFQVSNPRSLDRAPKLFSYVKSFLDFGVPVLKPTWALLIEEALHVLKQGPEVTPFASASDHLFKVVEKLSKGDFDSGALQLVLERKGAARDTRTMTKAHLTARPKLTSILRQVSSPNLPRWIARQATSAKGRAVLAGHLQTEFPSNALNELSHTAKRLLASRRYRVSHALVRSDLYVNWRCAHNGSLRSDVPDDIFHVVNASYCDLFVTTDRDQASYVIHALNHSKVLLYDKTEPLSKWLAGETF
jgi:hypothetical protein